MELNEALKLLISLGIGCVIGLDRERGGERLTDNFKDNYAPLGVRTFSLIAILGCLTGIMVTTYLTFALFVSGVFGALLLIYYAFHTWTTKDIGITTEIAMLFTYVLGFLIAVQILPTQLVIAVAVILLLVLSKKDQIKGMVKNVNQNEMNAFASYAIIALLILPFLPNVSIKFSDIPYIETIASGFGWNLQRIYATEFINPSKLWTVVALITGLDLFGHFFERSLGRNKGWILTSIAGGFISSTAATISLAVKSKKMRIVNPLVTSALLSNMASFFQIAILIGAINSMLLVKSFTVILLLIFSSLACALFYHYSVEKESEKEIQHEKDILTEKQIINLGPALKFAVVFLAVRLLSKISLEFFGSTGFLMTTALGSLSGLDSVLINASEMVGKSITAEVGVWALVIANGVNLISKAVYSFMQGSREFAFKLSLAIIVIIASSVFGMVLG